MARWRVDYIGKKGSPLGWVEAETEREAIDAAAKQFNITPARRFKITVTRRPTDGEKSRARRRGVRSPLETESRRPVYSHHEENGPPFRWAERSRPPESLSGRAWGAKEDTHDCSY